MKQFYYTRVDITFYKLGFWARVFVLFTGIRPKHVQGIKIVNRVIIHSNEKGALEFARKTVSGNGDITDDKIEPFIEPGVLRNLSVH